MANNNNLGMIKIIFSRKDEQIFVLETETDETFECFYYDFVERKPTTERVIFNKRKLIGWQLPER
jgi:hypothetical protein